MGSMTRQTGGRSSPKALGPRLRGDERKWGAVVAAAALAMAAGAAQAQEAASSDAVFVEGRSVRERPPVGAPLVMVDEETLAGPDGPCFDLRSLPPQAAARAR